MFGMQPHKLQVGYVIAGEEYLKVKRMAFFCVLQFRVVGCLTELNFKCFLFISSVECVHVNPCLVFRSSLHFSLFFFFFLSLLLTYVDPKVLQALKVGGKTIML